MFGSTSHTTVVPKVPSVSSGDELTASPARHRARCYSLDPLASFVAVLSAIAA
jgi:hypothetical protein